MSRLTQFVCGSGIECAELRLHIEDIGMENCIFLEVSEQDLVLLNSIDCAHCRFATPIVTRQFISPLMSILVALSWSLCSHWSITS